MTRFSQVLPHPAEANLSSQGKPLGPCSLGPEGQKQWVGFERVTWQQDEPVVLKVKGRRIRIRNRQVRQAFSQFGRHVRRPGVDL